MGGGGRSRVVTPTTPGVPLPLASPVKHGCTHVSIKTEKHFFEMMQAVGEQSRDGDQRGDGQATGDLGQGRALGRGTTVAAMSLSELLGVSSRVPCPHPQGRVPPGPGRSAPCLPGTRVPRGLAARPAATRTPQALKKAPWAARGRDTPVTRRAWPRAPRRDGRRYMGARHRPLPEASTGLRGGRAPCSVPWTPRPEISRPSRRLSLRGFPGGWPGPFGSRAATAGFRPPQLPAAGPAGGFQKQAPHPTPPHPERARLWRQAAGPVQRGWPGGLCSGRPPWCRPSG